MTKDILIGKTRYHVVKAAEQKNNALARAREKYLMQTKAFRVPVETWQKLKILSWVKKTPMTSLIVEAVDTFVERELEKINSNSENDETPEINISNGRRQN